MRTQCPLLSLAKNRSSHSLIDLENQKLLFATKVNFSPERQECNLVQPLIVDLTT